MKLKPLELLLSLLKVSKQVRQAALHWLLTLESAYEPEQHSLGCVAWEHTRTYEPASCDMLRYM